MNHKLFTSLIDKPGESMHELPLFMHDLLKSFLLMRNKPKVILICGMNKGDGSSSIASLLSIAISKYTDSRITLIDANCDSPYIHELVGIENTAGYAEAISGETNVEDMIKTVSNSSLSILTAGHVKGFSHRLINQNLCKQVIDPLTKSADYIIVDGAPLLSHVTDSYLLASIIGNMVIIVRSGTCRWEILENTKSNIASLDVNILGVILNCAEQPIPGFIYRHM